MGRTKPNHPNGCVCVLCTFVKTNGIKLGEYLKMKKLYNSIQNIGCFACKCTLEALVYDERIMDIKTLKGGPSLDHMTECIPCLTTKQLSNRLMMNHRYMVYKLAADGLLHRVLTSSNNCDLAMTFVEEGKEIAAGGAFIESDMVGKYLNEDLSDLVLSFAFGEKRLRAMKLF